MKYLSIIILSLIYFQSFSQHEGEVVYLFNDVDPGFSFDTGIKSKDKKLEDSFKKASQKKYTLFFKQNESLFKELKTLNLNPNGFEIINATGLGTLYKNNKVYINQLEYLGKRFLVEDKLTFHEWKLTKETKEILGHLCKKAITHNDYIGVDGLEYREKIIAYFTENIKSNQGPEFLFGLPGLILEAHIGEKKIYAEKIELKSNTKIKVPSSGKKVTRKEYESILKNRFK